jgi:hypothetical protein
MHPDSITQLVAATFAELGADQIEPITRTILLRDRYFVGYQFSCAEMRAIWFTDGGVIKLYDRAGKLVRKIDPKEQVKQAA